MKAAVLHEAGGVPRCEEFPDPVAGAGEVVIEVKAVAVENVDRVVAAGKHYASVKYASHYPLVPGFDGVGTLPEGTVVGFANPRLPYGALAQKTVVAAVGGYGPVPEGLDPAIAVVLSTAVTCMSVKTAAGLVPGETVLVQGATGVAGRLAVQVVRLLGAGRIVATGRDQRALREVADIGADVTINTAVSDEDLARALAEAKGDGYDVVLDVLWGRPTEILLRTLVPDSFGLTKPTRLIQVGEAAGASLSVAAESLRTSGVENMRRLEGDDRGRNGRALWADRAVGAVRGARVRDGEGAVDRDRERVAADGSEGSPTGHSALISVLKDERSGCRGSSGRRAGYGKRVTKRRCQGVSTALEA